MNEPVAAPAISRADLIGWGITAVLLVLVIRLHLLPALLAGLLVFELVDALVPRLKIRALGHDGPRLLAVGLVAVVTIALLTAAGFGIVGFLRSSDDSVPFLLQKMAQIIDDARTLLPAGLVSYIPDDAETLRLMLVDWLRSHAGSLQLAGRDVGRALVHVLMGMVIGALLSLHTFSSHHVHRPLAMRMTAYAARLGQAFRRVVFAQFWISTINTFFTWLYLGVALPAFGVELPFLKTLVAITFFAGLMPILGNLISNTAIFIVSLSHGLPVAVGSLLYLIVIHKLEYFLNARIIGSHIQARAWELLIAMLVMEAAFGIPGLIAAPIFYAYFKNELREKGLV